MDLLNAIGKRRCAKTNLESARDADPRDPSKPLGRSIQESSPVGSSASNGFIEKGVQDVEGQARTIKHALETRIGSKVPSDHDVIPWMLEYTAVLTNRCQVGIDGETSYERLNGETGSVTRSGVRRKSPMEGERPR